MFNKTHPVLMTHKSLNAQAKRVGGVVLGTIALMMSNTPAAAQDAAPATSSDVYSQGLNLNLSDETFSFSSDISSNALGRLEIPTESVGSTLFKLDLANTDCLTGETNCLRRDDTLDLGYSKRIASVSPTGIDLSLTPRAALRRTDDSSSAALGAVFEIGEDLRKGAGIANNTWYIFAGADAEALNYSAANFPDAARGQFYLQDNIIVGDARAGLGYRIGDADVSLSYNHREANSEDFKFKEDAAALSFTWKR